MSHAWLRQLVSGSRPGSPPHPPVRCDGGGVGGRPPSFAVGVLLCLLVAGRLGCALLCCAACVVSAPWVAVLPGRSWCRCRSSLLRSVPAGGVLSVPVPCACGLRAAVAAPPVARLAAGSDRCAFLFFFPRNTTWWELSCDQLNVFFAFFLLRKMRRFQNKTQTTPRVRSQRRGRSRGRGPKPGALGDPRFPTLTVFVALSVVLGF